MVRRPPLAALLCGGGRGWCVGRRPLVTVSAQGAALASFSHRLRRRFPLRRAAGTWRLDDAASAASPRRGGAAGHRPPHRWQFKRDPVRSAQRPRASGAISAMTLKSPARLTAHADPWYHGLCRRKQGDCTTRGGHASGSQREPTGSFRGTRIHEHWSDSGRSQNHHPIMQLPIQTKYQRERPRLFTLFGLPLLALASMRCSGTKSRWCSNNSCCGFGRTVARIAV